MKWSASEFESIYCRRSPCGERGLKSATNTNVRTRTRSLPVRGAWIEMAIAVSKADKRELSLPVRGAWIEISISCVVVTPMLRRSPCGERGLKWHPGGRPLDAAEGSLPVRGAWIEMGWTRRTRRCGLRSLPVRGAWIEIFFSVRCAYIRIMSLPVRGAWIEITSVTRTKRKSGVAPRAGSVD